MADLRSHQPTGKPGITPCASSPNQEILPRFSRASPTLIPSRPGQPHFQFQRSPIFLSSKLQGKNARKPKIKESAATRNGRDRQSLPSKCRRCGRASLPLPRNAKQTERKLTAWHHRSSSACLIVQFTAGHNRLSFRLHRGTQPISI